MTRFHGVGTQSGKIPTFLFRRAALLAAGHTRSLVKLDRPEQFFGDAVTATWSPVGATCAMASSMARQLHAMLAGPGGASGIQQSWERGKSEGLLRGSADARDTGSPTEEQKGSHGGVRRRGIPWCAMAGGDVPRVVVRFETPPP